MIALLFDNIALLHPASSSHKSPFEKMTTRREWYPIKISASIEYPSISHTTAKKIGVTYYTTADIGFNLF